MSTEQELNDKIFLLNSEGLSPGKIAQKVRIKKSAVIEILGESKNNGLGDIVTQFTEVTGIKDLVEAVVDDCGCKARAAVLNKVFPNKKLKDLLTDDYNFLKSFFEPKKPTSVNIPTQTRLVEVFNHVFSAKREVSNCGPCLAGLVNQLEKIYYAANNQ